MNNKPRLDDQETEEQKWKKKKTYERPKEAEQKKKTWKSEGERVRWLSTYSVHEAHLSACATTALGTRVFFSHNWDVVREIIQ
jgi:hypothetical protein